MQVKKKNKS